MWLSETWILFAITFVPASNVRDVSYTGVVGVCVCMCSTIVWLVSMCINFILTFPMFFCPAGHSIRVFVQIEF